MTSERRSRPPLLLALLLPWVAALTLLIGAPSGADAATSPAAAIAMADAAGPAQPTPAPVGAPAGTPSDNAGGAEGFLAKVQSMSGNPAVQLGARILLAILLFIGGWIVAKLISYAVFQLFSRTDIDNRIAQKLRLSSLVRPKDGEEGGAIEKAIAKVVYYLLMLLVVIAVLDFAGLSQVAGPLESFVKEIVGALPEVGKAGLIVLVAWVAARVLRMVVSGALDSAGVDRRFAKLADGDKSDRVTPFSETAGNVVFWLIMLVGIAGGFEALHIGALANPLHNAIDQIVGVLPSVGIAFVIVAVGYFGGRIVRALVRNVLQGLGFDKLVEKVKLDRLTGKTSASDILGISAMVFIIVQASIAALNQIGLETLSDPLTGMMEQFWNLLPPLAVSVVIVVVTVFVGQLLRRLVAGALRNLGLDRFMERLGFKKLSEREDKLGEYSELVGFAVQIAVVLLGVAQALDNLALQTWAGYVNAFLSYIVKNVAVATIVVGVGFGIGNYVRDLIKARESGAASEWMGEFARYAVLVFAFTMAVRQLDVAEDFVLLTFGLLFGALCLGAALAFGLGGREVAGEIVKKRYDQARTDLNRPRPPTPPAPPTPPGG